MRTKAEATNAAKKCLKLMKTEGWSIRVWENLGWHWQLRNGYINLHTSDDDTYFVLMSDELGGSGSPSFWTDPHCSYKDPNKAVDGALRCAATFVKEATRVVEKQKQLLKERKEK